MSKKFVHVEQREWSPPREPIPTNPMKFVFPRGDGKPDCIPLIISQIGNSPACALSIRGRVRKERLPPETKWLQRRRKNITLLGRRDSAKTNAIGFLRKKESLLQIKLQSQSPRHFKRSLGPRDSVGGRPLPNQPATRRPIRRKRQPMCVNPQLGAPLAPVQIGETVHKIYSPS